MITIYDDIPGKTPYLEAEKVCRELKKKKLLHIGQLKLLYIEILYLSLYSRDNDTVLYIGAADGFHITILAAMFPTLQFDLWDSREIHSKGANVIIYQEFFTQKSVKKYSKHENDLLVICDIRSMEIGTAKQEGNMEKMDNIVIENMNVQMEWCKLINPRYAMLKFRCPYEKDIKYLNGVLYLQPFNKETSTEMRLITNDYETLINYNHKEIEERLAWLNVCRCNNYSQCDKYKRLLNENNLRNMWDMCVALEILATYNASSITKSDKYITGENKTVIDLFLQILKQENKLQLAHDFSEIKLGKYLFVK